MHVDLADGLIFANRIFSLSSLALSTALSPFIFILESSVPMSGRIFLAATAISVSLVIFTRHFARSLLNTTPRPGTLSDNDPLDLAHLDLHLALRHPHPRFATRARRTRISHLQHDIPLPPPDPHIHRLPCSARAVRAAADDVEARGARGRRGGRCGCVDRGRVGDADRAVGRRTGRRVPRGGQDCTVSRAAKASRGVTLIASAPAATSMCTKT